MADMSKHRKRVAAELKKNPLYGFVAAGRQWVCPYCIGLASGKWSRADAEQVAVILDHFAECTDWDGFKGAMHKGPELRRVKERRELRSLVKKSLVKCPEWQFSGVDRRWYCPFCVKQSDVKIPANRKMDETILGGIIAHVERCYEYKKHEGTPRPQGHIQGVVTSDNRKKRLLREIREALTKADGVWAQRDQTGAWICPYCHKNASHIDISSPLLRRENAPQLIVTHLTQACMSYSDEAKPSFVKGRGKSANKAASKRKGKKRKASLEGSPESPPRGRDGTKRLPKKKGFGGWGRDGEIIAERHGVSLKTMKSSGEYQLIGDLDLPDSLRHEEEESATPLKSPKSLDEKLEDWKLDIEKELAQVQNVVQKAGKRRQGEQPAEVMAKAPQAPTIPKVLGFEIQLQLGEGANSGGDFIDFIRMGRKIAVVVGSVQTRTEDAGSIATMTRNLIRIHVREASDPAEALRGVNADIFDDLGPKTVVNLFLGFLDPRKSRLTYCRAGLIAPVLFNPGDRVLMRVADSEGLAVGADRGQHFDQSLSTTPVDLEPEDLIVIHSGGVLELRNRHREPFGAGRLEQIVVNYGNHEAEYFTDKLREKLETFTKQSELNCQLAVLAVKRQERAGLSSSWDFD